MSPDELLRELGELATSVGPAVRPAGTDELLRSLTETARRLFGAAACSLALLSEDDSELLYTVAAGEGADDVTGMRISSAQGIAGWVVQSGQPIAISDLSRDPRFSREVAEQTGYVPQSILAVPVETAQRTLGVISLLEGPHDDLFGHGTACAGIIRRAAPDAAIWSVRVLGSKLTGKGLVFATGIRWAIAQGARVVNLSLSTGREDYFGLFHQIADEAAFAGVVLVCAVNNVPAPTYPAEFSSVISVAAHDGRDPFGLDANPTPPADFGAPGIDIPVPWLSGSTIVSTGNSFAAAHVSGLAARLLSKHPHLRPYEVKTVLRAVAGNAVPQGASHDH